jgi:photosystem I subunit 11
MKFIKFFLYVNIYYIVIYVKILVRSNFLKKSHLPYIFFKNSFTNLTNLSINFMANFIKPYNDDPFVGHLATPITSSAVTRAILQNLPAYRFGLTPLLRGLEIGLAHGYFLIGPFVKLGPLRDSDISLLAGFLSTIGLIIILTLGLTIYGIATFGQEKSEGLSNNLQTKKAWDQFKGGFFVGACGSAGFAFICLSSIPTFTTN